MASKRCPKCGLVNPATAERCDCGRSFVDGSQGASLGQRTAKAKGGAGSEHLRNERDAAVRRARGWILGVGIMMFVVDQFFIHVLYGSYISDGWKLKLFLIDTVILLFFIAMFVLAKTKPLAACIAALCGFWALHLTLAVINPGSLFQGILPKVLFTIALVGGIQSANRAQKLQDQLAEIFD